MKVQDHKAIFKITFIFALFLCFFSFNKVSASSESIGNLTNYSGTISFSNSYTFTSFSSSQINNDIESFITTNKDTFIDRYYSTDSWFDKYNYICLTNSSNGYKCYVQLTNSINDIVYGGITENPDAFYLSFNYFHYSSPYFVNIGFAYNFFLEYDSSGNLIPYENLTNICQANNLCGYSFYYSTSYSSEINIDYSLLDSYNNQFYNLTNINTSYFSDYYSISQYYSLVSNGSYSRSQYNQWFQSDNSVYVYDYSNLDYLYYHNDFEEGGGDSGGTSIDDSVVINTISSQLSTIIDIIGSSGSSQTPGSFGTAGSYGTDECLGLHCIVEEWHPTFTTVISETMTAIQYLFSLLDRVVNLNSIVFNMILVCLGLGVARLVLGR